MARPNAGGVDTAPGQPDDREMRLLAKAQGFSAAAKIGLKEARPAGAGAHDDGAKTRRTTNVIEAAGAGRAGDGAAAGLIRHGDGDAPRHAAGGAADRVGARLARDDGEGEVRAWGVL